MTMIFGGLEVNLKNNYFKRIILKENNNFFALS